MNLTEEQTRALKEGRPIRLIDSETGLECVVLRADIYDRFETALIDDSPLTEEEKLWAIREAGKRAGWDDPELDVYEEYRQ